MGKCEWRHAPEARGGLGEILKKSVSGVKSRHRTRRVDFRLLAESLGRCRTRWGRRGRWKCQNTKIVPLSSYVEKPLKSKIIKSFVPEQRSHKCFSSYEIPMFYVIYIYIYIYIWTCYVHFTHSRIWLWYTQLNVFINFHTIRIILFTVNHLFEHS